MSITVGGLEVVSMNLVKQWGLSPASGTFTAVGSGSVAEGNAITLSVGGFTFAGIITDAVLTEDEGRTWSITAVDYREKLKDDTVYGFFNKEVVWEDDITTPGIDRRRYFQHLTPENWSTYTLTWTDAPLTAKQILQQVLVAPTVRHGWTASSHARLDMKPTFVDFETGKELGVVVQEILDQCGLVLGIDGTSRLEFAVPGEGTLPPFPAASTNRSVGQALAQAPTRVYVVGDRNLYQYNNIALEPDWKSGWEAWWGELQWLAKVKSLFSLSDSTKAARAELAAKARTVTVREVVERESTSLADYGLWGEVSRMEIPAWTYLQDIVFKAYRIPRTLVVNQTPLRSTELQEGLIAALTYDATSGYHSVKEPYELYPETKAFVTVQGQPLDVWDPTRSGEFDPNLLQAARTRWQANNRFTLDSRNHVLVFEEATFVDGAGDGSLIVFPNQHANDIDDDLRYLAVPNAAAEIGAAPVRASLVFAVERFRAVHGNGRRADTVHQPGLSKHQVGTRELTYADGDTADQKARELANHLLDQPSSIYSGGFTRIGSAGTTLNGAISSVNITVGFDQGIAEQVTYSHERNILAWDSERELERRRKSRELFPGQKRLQNEADQLRQTAVHLKAATRPQQRYYQNIGDVLMRPVTNREPNPAIIQVTQSGVTPQVGDVIWRNSDGEIGVLGAEMMGVVIAANVTGQRQPLARQGVVPVRVRGPVTAGTQVGCDPPGEDADQNELVPATANGRRLVGRVQRDHGTNAVILVPVQLNAPGDPAVLQLRIEAADSQRAKIYFGEAYGLGFAGLIENLEDEDWKEFDVSGTTKFYLKVTFDPEVESRPIPDGEGGVTDRYFVAAGGTVESVVVVDAASPPDDTTPVINPDTGEVEEQGEYHYHFGTATASSGGITCRNEFYGPVALNFCPPNSFRVTEMRINPQIAFEPSSSE